ncbi:toll/interleukin-1 receptor domain-containing protein [Cellulomonas cellasea]|uniref:TIR domain-containing protein n=1 Tax=Cellulomonas cellasea TaxID=43670 RepID=A0A7W4YDQ0_9CELL|nr:toll/interleukin-1 receptor domain-containing protein [Cellulomonas cellasea]MBB2925389.1 hypothetical protein [Cellulomonas cellasea]
MSAVKIFESYSRTDADVAGRLAADLTDAGFEVWRDQRLAGGVVWWEAILEQIRLADALVLVLSEQSVDSVPCAREVAYAVALGKPVLPVRVNPQTSPRRVPPMLATREWVDYDDERTAILHVVRALNTLPPPEPLPTPLPPAPDVPLSYTSNLAAIVHQAEDLSPAAQQSLLFQLREGLADEADADECRALLTRLSSRRELLASVAREIDRELARVPVGATAGIAGAAPVVDRSPDAQIGMLAAPPGPPAPPVMRPMPRGAGPGSGLVPPAAPPGPRRGPRWGWIIAGSVGALLLVLVLVLAGVAAVFGGTRLDTLVDDCTAGDMESCDSLYLESDGGSSEELFGATCGDRIAFAVDGGCVELSNADTYGDHSGLDGLWDECVGGSLVACDDLYNTSGSGSRYESFGSSCGDRTSAEGELAGSCAADLPFPYTFGDSADLDPLWERCAAGDLVGCDDLYWASEDGSAYEQWAAFCGRTDLAEPANGYCATQLAEPVPDAAASTDVGSRREVTTRAGSSRSVDGTLRADGMLRADGTL